MPTQKTKKAKVEDESLLSVGGLVETVEKAERRWDVFIYAMASREIVSVAGEDLPETGSFHTVDKRIETAMERINLDTYSVAAVATGKFKKGDVLPKDVETYG